MQVILIGDAEVGKTSLVHVLNGERLSPEYKPTKNAQVYMSDPAKITYKSKATSIMIVDYASDSDPKSRQDAYKMCKVVIICFAMDSPDSFAHVRERWAKEVSVHNACGVWGGVGEGQHSK